MNKKAQFDVARKSIYWMLAGIVITMAILAFAIILSSYQSKVTTVPPELRAELISLRFINTPECFTYQDPVTGRIFPGVIDVAKFTQERVDQCYRTKKEKGFKDFNFGLALEGYTPLNAQGQLQPLRTNNFFNQVDFTLYRPVLVRAGSETTVSRMIIYVQTKI